MDGLSHVTLHTGETARSSGSHPYSKDYSTKPVARQGLRFLLSIFTRFDKDDIIGESEGGRSTPKGGGRMAFSDVCNLLLVVLQAINLGIVIATIKRK